MSWNKTTVSSTLSIYFLGYTRKIGKTRWFRVSFDHWTYYPFVYIHGHSLFKQNI